MPISFLTYVHPSSAHMGGLSLSGPWNHEGLTTIARTWKHQAARLLTKGEEEVDESATKGEQHSRNEVPRLIIGPRIYIEYLLLLFLQVTVHGQQSGANLFMFVTPWKPSSSRRNETTFAT